MPVQIAKGQARQLGAGRSGNLGVVSRERCLLIFRDPLFVTSDFGVRNKEFIPGRNPGDFVGLDNLGWGVHPNGAVDVVDPNECRHGFGIGTRSISWEVLWKLEADERELRFGQRDLKEGYRLFLNRVIKSVSLSKTDIQTVPDPRLWVVMVSQKNTEALGPNVVGKLAPWPRFTPEVEELRLSTYELRPVNIEFKGRENQTWPKGRSPGA